MNLSGRTKKGRFARGTLNSERRLFNGFLKLIFVRGFNFKFKCVQHQGKKSGKLLVSLFGF
jgi:hypothetical protein